MLFFFVWNLVKCQSDCIFKDSFKVEENLARFTHASFVDDF
jgi:hypothetical protein